MPGHTIKQDTGRKGRTAKTILFLCAVLIVLVLVGITAATRATQIRNTEELAGFDFSSNIAYISPECFETYPGKLLKPEDFSSGTPRLPIGEMREDTMTYSTYRITLNLDANKIYGLSGYSATYAQMVWINGVLRSTVGIPGDSIETSVPKTNYYAVYFEAVPGENEIIIQRSGFIHSSGGQLFSLYLGEQEQIGLVHNGIVLRSALVIGIMLMASFFFLGVYFFISNHRQFLWFSLSCLFIAFRSLCVDHKLIMILMPDLSWHLAHKLEYMATIAFIAFFFIYLNNMFGWRVPRAIDASGIAACVAFFLISLLSPSVVYTRLLPFFQYIALVYGFCFILFTIKRIRGAGADDAGITAGLPERIAILAGTIGMVSVYCADLFLHELFAGIYEDMNLSQIGMLVFVYANTLALIQSFDRKEQKLRQALRNERDMEETNRMYVRLDKIKSDFLGNISHELKTPLTVMSGYAQQTAKELEHGFSDENTQKNLMTIVSEAARLAQLADQALETSVNWQDGITMAPVAVEKIVDRAVAVCKPILDRHNTRIESMPGDECVQVTANLDMVVQVLINLCVNAGRHTRGGVVQIRAYPSEDGDYVLFSVVDDGTGIPAGLLPHVFDRGVSGDGKSGLGLSICKEIVESHSGTIEVHSQSEGNSEHFKTGTTVTFTLPIVR